TTLDKLKAFPESSVYRQAVEAVTKHRLAVIESTKPAGFEQWEKSIKEAIAQDEARKQFLGVDGSYVVPTAEPANKEELDFYGDKAKAQDEGPSVDEEEAQQKAAWAAEAIHAQIENKVERLPQEPPLTAEQVTEIENQIGAGLLEEIIQVAEGELSLVDQMYEAKVWEDLEEKPQPGQWKYFERDP
ncbi:hypothetical protein KEM56_001371, partial [Ascosphaera pollenicola]